MKSDRPFEVIIDDYTLSEDYLFRNPEFRRKLDCDYQFRDLMREVVLEVQQCALRDFNIAVRDNDFQNVKSKLICENVLDLCAEYLKVIAKIEKSLKEFEFKGVYGLYKRRNSLVILIKYLLEYTGSQRLFFLNLPIGFNKTALTINKFIRKRMNLKMYKKVDEGHFRFIPKDFSEGWWKFNGNSSFTLSVVPREEVKGGVWISKIV